MMQGANLIPAPRWGVLSLALCLVGGCGSEPTGTVRGMVFYQGKPLPGGLVSFFSAPGKVVTGRIGEDGRYVVPDVPVGLAKIAVQDLAGGFGGRPASAPGAKGSPTAVRVPLHYRSADGSGLKYNVSSGDQEHDITLKD
jgi:hypothetical protein